VPRPVTVRTNRSWKRRKLEGKRMVQISMTVEEGILETFRGFAPAEPHGEILTQLVKAQEAWRKTGKPNPMTKYDSAC
jgi:hypothetical protein